MRSVSRWLFLVVGLVVLVVAGLALYGASLPIGHLAVVAVRLEQPPAVVWNTVSDVENWPSWNPGLTVTRAPDQNGHPVYVVSDRMGDLASEVVESTPPSGGSPGRLVTRLADPNQPFGGRWIWEVAPANGGTRVSITEDGEIYNVLFRAIASLFIGYTATAEDHLRALGTKHGAAGSPEVVRAR